MFPNMKIQTLISINDYILIVFYTAAHAWEFRLISPDGSIYGKKGIYYTAEAAHREARAWVLG